MTVLAGSDRFRPYETRDLGVRIIRLESHRNPYWPANPVPAASVDTLEQLIERLQPDVIHSHDSLPFLLQLVRARERLGVPLMATCHYYPSFVASYLASRETTSEWVERLAWRYTTELYNRVEDVVFATFTHRRRFTEHGLTTRTHIISNGVDTSRYTPHVPPLDVAARYGIPRGRRVLAVGRLAKDKNLELLISAVAMLDEDVRLLIVGEGPERSRLEEHAAGLGAQRRVHFLGFVPESDLPGLYRACNAYAISSNHEVQSLPALQAAASGIPIVAAEQGSLPEICRDGKNGILVRRESETEWAEAIRATLQETRAAEMGRAGRELARLHDEQRTFARYEALYRQLLMPPARKAALSQPRLVSTGASAAKQ